METYHGHVRTPADAIILFEACRIGLLPRVQRRLSEKERQSIKSGSVFVWDEREAGMRRWTDGKSWSASRVSGSFLTYREMEGKRGGGHVPRAGKTPESNRGSDEDGQDAGEEGPDGYRYKPDGLMKQSFSITTSTGQHLHLISYYARSHPNAPGLNQPSTDPALRHIRPQKGLYPESSVNDQQNLPVVTRGPMAGAMSMPPLAYGRTTAGHPHSYAPPPYAWSPALLGHSHVPVIPYVPNYLPSLGHNGHPVSYAHHPAYAHPHPHYPPPYDRMVHPLEAQGLPTPMQGAHGMPYYSPGRPPVLSSPESTAGHGSPHHPSVSQGSQIDPRLSTSGTDAAAGHSTSSPQAVQTASSTPSKHAVPEHHAQLNTKNEPSSSATVVPSINALVNAAPAASPSHHPAPPSNGAAPAESQENGDTSRTANGSFAEGPQDIPSDKIGFGEDTRALRQLDRVFSA